MQAYLQAATSGSSSRRGEVLDYPSSLLRFLFSLLVLPPLVLPLLPLPLPLPLPPLPLPLHAAAATAEEEQEREKEEEQEEEEEEQEEEGKEGKEPNGSRFWSVF